MRISTFNCGVRFTVCACGRALCVHSSHALYFVLLVLCARAHSMMLCVILTPLHLLPSCTAMDVADTNAPTSVSDTGLVVFASFGRSGYVSSLHRSDEAAAVSLNCGDIGIVIPIDAPPSEDEWTHVGAESRPEKHRHAVQDGRVPPSTIGAFFFYSPLSVNKSSGPEWPPSSPPRAALGGDCCPLARVSPHAP
jgi:hypothetical protein